MKLTPDEVTLLQTIVEGAKNKFFNESSYLRVSSSKLTDNLADLLVNGEIVKGKVVLAYEDKIPRTIEITDDIYDVAELELKAHGVKVGLRAAAPVGKFTADLPYDLPSLDKTRPGEPALGKYLRKNRGPYMVSKKMDGLTLEVVYDPGVPVKVYTGTELSVGKDVSFLAPRLNLPDLRVKSRLAIRCEGIISKANFEKYYSEKYKAARNLASGVFNKKGFHEAIGHVDLVVYEVLEPRGVPSKQLSQLKRLGFHTVDHVVVDDVDESYLSRLLKKWKATTSHEMDGIVVTVDRKTPVPSGTDNSTIAIAFKERDDASNLAEAEVVDVVWAASKHGYLIPRINIKPVKLAGVTVNWVTGHHANNIVENKIGPGAVIQVTRSGEVIPYVLKVLKPARRPQLPDKEEFGEYKWNDTKVDLVLTQKGASTNKTVAVKRLYTFLSDGLGIEFLGQGIVAKFIAAGFDTAKKVLTAKASDFLRVESFKDTMAAKMYSQIQDKSRRASIVKVAAASGFFGRTFGETKLQWIEDKWGILALSKRSSGTVQTRVAGLPGFSDTSAQVFADGLPKFVAWLSDLPIKFVAPAKVKAVGKKLEGQAVGFTGFRSAPTEEYIKQQGGTVTNGVTKQTTILLVKDPNENSLKLQKARAAGIEIYSLPQFVKKFGGPK